MGKFEKQETGIEGLYVIKPTIYKNKRKILMEN